MGLFLINMSRKYNKLEASLLIFNQKSKVYEENYHKDNNDYTAPQNKIEKFLPQPDHIDFIFWGSLSPNLRSV